MALFHVVPPDTRLIEQSLSDSLALSCDIVSQVVLVVKNPPTNAGDVRDTGLIPGWGRSPAGGCGNPLQYYFFYDLSLTILFFNLIFNWRIIALQYCDGFCHPWTWISHMHTYVPSVLNLPHPIPQNCHRADIPMDRGAWWAIWLSYHWVVRFIGMLSPSHY